MLFSIAMALMVVLVAGFWTYQGFLSSLLMFFECVIACAGAFGFYEALNAVWASSLGSGIGLPLAFMVIFLAVLVVLRLATDKFLPDDVKLPLVIDRAGAGVFGLLTGLMLVGTALVGVQMLPIGADIFGFDRLKPKADGTVASNGFLLGPDSFAVGLANLASSNGLAGGNPLSKAKPDLLQDLYGARSCVQTEDRHEIPADSIKVKAYWKASQIDDVTQKLAGTGLSREFTAKEATPGNEFLVFDVSLDRNACLKDKSEMYLRLPQFRLVGPPPESGSPKVFLACGMSDIYINKQHNWNETQEGQATRLVRFRPDTDFFLSPTNTKAVAELVGKSDLKGFRVNVAFEVPENFEPWFLVFKTGARCEINKQRMFKAAPPKGAAVSFGSAGPGRSAGEPKSKEGKAKAGKAPGGAGHVADAKEGAVTTKLPVPLSKDTPAVQRALKGDKLGECHLLLDLPRAEIPRDEAVTEFDAPEGKKLLLVDADRFKALSMYGRALNYAANVAAQITVTTTDGTTYFAQGVYSMAKSGGKTWFEVQYHPEAEVPERALEKPKKVTPSMLQDSPPDSRKFGYIFIVDPGVEIATFSSGGKGSTQDLQLKVPK